MFVLYAYECPILSAYTVQQSRSILSVDFENQMWDKKITNYNLTLHFPIEAKFLTRQLDSDRMVEDALLGPAPFFPFPFFPFLDALLGPAAPIPFPVVSH